MRVARLSNMENEGGFARVVVKRLASKKIKQKGSKELRNNGYLIEVRSGELRKERKLDI